MSAMSSLLAGIILLLIFIWYRRSSGTDRQFRRLEKELASLARRRKRDDTTKTFLASVYKLLQQTIIRKDTPASFRAVELIKTAYGEGIIRTDEMSYLVGLSVMALRQKQHDVANVLVDAAKLLIKGQSSDRVRELLEQLQFLALILLKEKQNYIAAKIVDLIFYILDKPDLGNDHQVSSQAIDVLRTVGIRVIRRRDAAMLREIAGRLETWHAKAEPASDLELAKLLAAWLHRSIYSSEVASYELIVELIRRSSQKRVIASSAFELLISELQKLSGTLSLNPGSQIPGKLLAIILELGFSRDNINDSRQVVRSVGEVARLAIHNHDLTTAFLVFYPLLEQGRRLLTLELKFGGEASQGGHRQHTLFFVIKECLSVLEYSARKRMTDSVADLTAELIQCWETKVELQSTAKSFKKFCALILLYQNATRRTKSGSAEFRAAKLSLFAENEQERLKAFIGGIQHELLSGTGRKI